MNIANGMVILGQYVLGPLPWLICACSAIFKDVSGLTMLHIMAIIMVLRVLYASFWKSFGSLNEDFFFTFICTLLFLSIVLLITLMKLFNHYQQPSYFICVGQDATAQVSNLQSMNTIKIYGRCLFAFCLFASLYIKRKKKVLADLQRSTLDSMGLPRAAGSHPSYQSLISNIVLAVMLFSAFRMHFECNIFCDVGRGEMLAMFAMLMV